MKKYHEEHEWLVCSQDIATIGISKYAVEQLGDITFVELPEIGNIITAGDSVAFVESVKAASDIYTPVSGEITDINEDLLDDPGLLNTDAENAAWIFKVKLSDESQLEDLMDTAAYQKYIETL